jgi:fructose-1,6-bisphosphatase/inositol monophosphatase family enzyme
VDRPISASDSSNTIWLDGSTAQAANVARAIMPMRRWYMWKFSSTIAYAYLACGRIAAVLQFNSKTRTAPFGSVHTAAGCFIAGEAGAILTDIADGTPWEIGTRSFLIAATPELHRELSAIVASASGDEPQTNGNN